MLLIDVCEWGAMWLKGGMCEYAISSHHEVQKFSNGTLLLPLYEPVYAMREKVPTSTRPCLVDSHQGEADKLPERFKVTNQSVMRGRWGASLGSRDGAA